MEQRLIDANALRYHMGVNQNDKQIFYITEIFYITGEDIDAAPTIDPESLRPRSYWEDVYQTGPCSFSGRCHACGVRNDIPPVEQAYYCPNCGAKMEGWP